MQRAGNAYEVPCIRSVVKVCYYFCCFFCGWCSRMIDDRVNCALVTFELVVGTGLMAHAPCTLALGTQHHSRTVRVSRWYLSADLCGIASFVDMILRMGYYPTRRTCCGTTADRERARNARRVRAARCLKGIMRDLHQINATEMYPLELVSTFPHHVHGL